ncbi:MAG: serine hydrolase [Chitinophagaceae bacterium]
MSKQMQNFSSNILDSILKANPQYFENILANKDSFRVQIMYTKIDRDKNNQPHFTDYFFNVNNQHYFYPASTVKLPAALLALQKLNNLHIKNLDKNSLMKIDTSNTKESIATYIKQIFLVSDNNAFNHLYEFLGQEYIRSELTKKGYADAEIKHRLDISLTEEQNRTTNAIDFFDSAGNVIYHQPANYSNAQFSKRKTFLGKGYFNNNDSLINEPFNFSKKNRIYLTDLHQILRSVIFDESVSEKQRFNVKKEDYEFLHKYMSMYSRESAYPAYDSAIYYDAYDKLLLFGSQKEIPPNYIRIFNKEGDAYGFLTDVAYIADFKNNIEFFLSATIYCNSDGIFNDDKYDYDSVGYPFMKNLGNVIYQYELKRVKKFQPDLSSFNILYK